MDSRKFALLVRRRVVEMTSRGKSSHVASGLSIADILAVLYTTVMNVGRKNPGGQDGTG